MSGQPFARFYFEPVLNKRKTEEAGRPKYDQKEFVEITKPNDRTYKLITEARDHHRENFAAAYRHFKETQKKPESGTPLNLIPIFTADQVLELTESGVRTLEEFTGISPDEIRSDMKELHKQAMAYLDAANDKGTLARKFANAEKLRAALEEENQDLQAALKAANEELETLRAMTKKDQKPAASGKAA